MFLKSQRQRRHRQGKSNRVERGGGGREKPLQSHQRSRGGHVPGVGDSEHRRDSRGEGRCRSSTPGSKKSRDVLHRDSRGGKMSPGSVSSTVGGRHGFHQSKGDLVAPEQGPQAFRGDSDGTTDDRGGRDGGLNVNTVEMTEEGLELVEAPDVELAHGRELSGHSASTDILAAGAGMERGEGGLVIRRQLSSEGSSYEEAGAGGFEEDRGVSPTRKGDEDGVQVIFDALAVSPTCKRLSRGLESETLLGTEGTAPPLLIDGAVAGLAAVLGEMHREEMFFVTADDATVENASETRSWSYTRAKVSRFGCCPDLLHDILGDGELCPPRSGAMSTTVGTAESEMIEIGDGAGVPA